MSLYIFRVCFNAAVSRLAVTIRYEISDVAISVNVNVEHIPRLAKIPKLVATCMPVSYLSISGVKLLLASPAILAMEAPIL